MTMKPKTKHLRPWLFVVGAFALLVAAWTSLIFIAVKHSPETVPIQTLNSKQEKTSRTTPLP